MSDPTTEMVDRVARALCESDGEPWDEAGGAYRRYARAAISAHEAALAEAGYVIVRKADV